MKVEILFPEVCNLYGDLQNVYYLRRCCPELEVIETDLHSKPRFLTEDVALVYMGSTTEQGLALAADALRPYTAEMAAKLDAGQLMLLTGNAPDVFSDAMDSDSADTIKGLGVLPGRVKYTIPEGTQTGTVFRLRGKGIPVLNGRGRGDQYVTVTIETPRDLNREQKEALKKFSETLGENNYEKRRSFFGKKK